jgi:glycosyltransferase involved in cell wall biosynthesis
MKIALVHDWLISPIGGAENTLTEIYALFPAPLYTLVWNAKRFEKTPFEHANVIPSWIQKLPGTFTHFRKFLPLFPRAIESFDLKPYELIISSSHCVAKGVKTSPNQLHICYCHTPMRYAWDLMDEYLLHANLHTGIRGWVTKKILQKLRQWDEKRASSVTQFIANSHFVAARIEKNYGRTATVIYPPVDTTYFSLCTEKQDFYVTSSRLVHYKRIDLIVEAFIHMPDLHLIVIGDGPEAPRLKKAGNIQYLGEVSKGALKNYLQKAKAFVFAAIEDFGIVPVEAMACGTPVIALQKGGSIETIIEHKTGLFFGEQTSPAIQIAVRKFETIATTFDPVAISQHAAQFSDARFRSEFKQFVEISFKNFYPEYPLSIIRDSESIS